VANAWEAIAVRRAGSGLILLALVAALPLGAGAADDWDALCALYDYDATAPLDVRLGATRATGAYVVESLSFRGAGGERVPALLIRPTGVERPPCVLFLHGLGGSKRDAEFAAVALAPQGIAVLAIDAARHGDRAQGKLELTPDLAAIDGPMVRTVIDNRRALDYLATRDDVNGDRVVLVGVSMGAILGAIVAGVDERIDAAALLVGGGGWEQMSATSTHPLLQRLREAGGPGAMAHVDPVNFAGHISPRPVLLVNGTQDAIIPREAAEALQAAAGEPRQIIWYEGGHVEMPPDVLTVVLSWITAQAHMTPVEAGE
jgi:dienelactone hydrolase